MMVGAISLCEAPASSIAIFVVVYHTRKKGTCPGPLAEGGAASRDFRTKMVSWAHRRWGSPQAPLTRLMAPNF
jgi:hypothetical protein